MRRILNVGMIALVVALAGCAEDEPALEDVPEPAAQEPAAGQTIEFSASEYQFDGIPSELQAGETTFALSNEGTEQHEFSLSLITGDQSVEELLELPEGQAQKLIQDVTHTAASPGGSAEATADLSPGRYGYVCFIPAPDGEPHALKGMFGEFTVA